MPQDPTTCLILGGGGARGLSHLGVLQVVLPAEADVGRPKKRFKQWSSSSNRTISLQFQHSSPVLGLPSPFLYDQRGHAREVLTIEIVSARRILLALLV